MSISVETRRLIARYCRDKNCRFVDYKNGAKWEPMRIDDPATGMPFSDQSAWALIADTVEDMSIELKEIVLRRPPGKRAYTWLIPQKGRSSIYVKVQIGARGVIARSFHYSDFEDDL